MGKRTEVTEVKISAMNPNMVEVEVGRVTRLWEISDCKQIVLVCREGSRGDVCVVVEV